MPIYKCLVDACNEDPFSIIITGNHFTKEKAMEVLIRKNEVSEEDNLEIVDMYHGWAKNVSNLEDYCSGTDSTKGYLFAIGAIQPEGYNLKATLVELAEVESDD